MKKLIFRSDGKITIMVPDLIEIGVDAINPIEPLSGMDFEFIKKEFGRDLTLIGAVDCSQLLPFGTVDEVRENVTKILDIGAPGGGFIIGDSSNVLPNTPVANIREFYNTVHEYT